MSRVIFFATILVGIVIAHRFWEEQEAGAKTAD
jgi:hypothetical protein